MSVTAPTPQTLHIMGSRPDLNLADLDEARPKAPSVSRLNSPSP
jgi:hypothetical protein